MCRAPGRGLVNPAVEGPERRDTVSKESRQLESRESGGDGEPVIRCPLLLKVPLRLSSDPPVFPSSG